MSLVVKDSLGLGIKKTITRENTYTDEENDQFTRQLLTPEEKEAVKKEDLLSIKDVRNIIRENVVRDTYDKMEPDLLIAIDSRINYNIYVVHDNIYTYEELCISFPFQEFNILPKSIFVRQIIVVFMDDTIEVFNEGDPIVSAHDMIKIATDKIKSQDEIKQHKKIINSKIFIGGEKWKDFLQLRGFFRGMVQVNNLQLENGQTPEFLKPFTAAISNQLMITNEHLADATVVDAAVVDEHLPASNNVNLPASDNVNLPASNNVNLPTTTGVNMEDRLSKIEDIINQFNDKLTHFTDKLYQFNDRLNQLNDKLNANDNVNAN
jgi:hypothetical protein